VAPRWQLRFRAVAAFNDPNQWGAPAGNFHLTRYSTLKDINTGNVHDMQTVWSQSSGTLRG
jgi:glucose dehydrogenase